VPVILGGSGVEKVVEIALDPAEKQMLDNSAKAVRELIEAKLKTTLALFRRFGAICAARLRSAGIPGI
jgi:predicted metal-dependent TIM-barrel fold hydrolase